MAEHRDVVGSGWRFPLSISERGGVELAQGYEEIEQAMQIILSTPLGFRLMRPRFGSRLHELVFAQINPSTMATAKHYVLEALGYWEPRIDVENVLVTPDSEQPSRLWITIVYRIKATHDERALVVPFYSIPAGEE